MSFENVDDDDDGQQMPAYTIRSPTYEPSAQVSLKPEQSLYLVIHIIEVSKRQFNSITTDPVGIDYNCDKSSMPCEMCRLNSTVE